MEPASLQAFKLAKSALFRSLGVTEELLEDLNGFENFVYGQGDRVIRITHDSHRSAEQLNAELTFLHHLANGGAPVARPLVHPGGEWVVSTGAFHVCLFERAEGEPMGERAYTPEVSRCWGQAIGGFHRLASGYVGGFHRPTWRDDENHLFAQRIPATQTIVLAQAKQLMQSLERLPADAQHFGLIHSDAHAGNFVHKGGRLTFFDFDDCLYAWFGYDLATILFGVVLHKTVGNSEPERVRAVDAFLPYFLEGYATQYDPASLLLADMPRLMKLREFSLYAVMHAHMDLQDMQLSYPRKFMQARQARLETNQPFVDANFEY